MEQKPFVSIIIPAFNTEKYLLKCVDSLCRQTFEDFEAIIINDGSTDNTGGVADELAQRDTRVRVIHTQNSGVAEARNTGLQYAQGRYIGFLDSDDWAESDMFEKLVEAAEKYDADIAICGHIRETYDGIPIKSEQPIVKSALWTAHEAQVKLLIDYKIRNYLWDKIYKRELFDGLSFPAGHLFEDQQVLYKLFEKASMVYYISQPLYHYIQRKESILGTKKISTDVEYLHSQLKMFRYVEDSDSFSKIERIVLRSCIGKNIIGVFRKIKKDQTEVAREETEKLLNEFKSCGFYHYQEYFIFYKIIFGIIKKWGIKWM